MTERINATSAEGESATWAITAGTIIQVAGAEESKAVVELHGRIDAEAPWAYIGSVRVATEAFLAVDADFAEAKLVWNGNHAGDTLQAWSVE